MKQKFKNKDWHSSKCIANILKYYALASASEITDGFVWYLEAHGYAKELAGRFGLTVSQSAGILAAFSPQAGWTENKRYAVTFLISPKRQVKNLVQTLKAKKILTLSNEADIYAALASGDNGKAFKTKAFFLNILNSDLITDVTIDRHALAIAFQNPNKVEALDESFAKLTRQQYNFFQYCYVQAALKLDILPQQLQAITWLVYRRLRDLKQHSELKHWQPFDESPF